MNRSLGLLLLLSLLACNPDKAKVVDQATISFDTDDGTRLFFKNVRQSYYDKEVMEAAKLDLYRLKKRPSTEERPLVNLVIVDNWRYDQAYLLLEPNSLLNAQSLTLNWTHPTDGDNGTITFANGNKETIVNFADQIYRQIQRGSALTVSTNDGEVQILEIQEDREAFRITMVDYYRLVQRL